MFHYVITEPCVNCKDAACVEICPVDAIHPRKDEREFAAARQLFINPDTCICCGLCVEECPVQAIFAADNVPPQWREYVQLNAEHFRKSA